MPRTSPYAIILTADEDAALRTMAGRYTSPYCDVIRAKVILLASERHSNEQIAQTLNLPRQIVSKWRKRFFDERLDGLHDRSRRGRPRVFSP